MNVRLLVTALAVVLACGCSNDDGDPASSETPSETRPLTGAVLLDGAVNGCVGEEMAVRVRDDTGVVASVSARSEVVGADCVFEFSLDVPIQDCYEVVVEGQPVGRYSAGALGEDGNLGIITADRVFGDPESTEPPKIHADFNNC